MERRHRLRPQLSGGAHVVVSSAITATAPAGAPPHRPPTLVPAPADLRVETLEANTDVITVVATTIRPAAACPVCRQPSARVHSPYVRTLADLPWQGIAVRVRLRTRRYYCHAPASPRAIFTERFPDVAAPYARQTVRLDATLRLIGAALGGAAGERLASALGMHTAGVTHVKICERLNLGRGTIRTWLRAGHFPERAAPSRGPRVPTRLAAYLEDVAAHVAAGATDVTTSVAALRAHGFTGTTHSVQRLVRRFLHERSTVPDAPEDGSRGAGGTQAKLPSPRRVSWLLFATQDELEPADRTFVAALCERAAPLAAVRHLRHQFRQMLRAHDTTSSTAHESPLRSFVRGLRYDFEAVYAGIALPWSQGPVEGQVHRLQLVKRSMYGRAKFPVFKRRVLAAT